MERGGALEDADGRPHRGLELDHVRRGRVARVDGLAVDDHRQPQHAVALVERPLRARAGSTQMLFALKKRWREVSSKASWSSSGTWAVSRSTSPPSSRRRARCPPLRSASVRSTTSERNGSSSRANQLEDARVEHGAEVVRVRQEQVLVAVLQQRVEHARRGERGEHVAVARAAPTRAPGPPPRPRARSCRPAASAPCPA